MRLKDRGVYFLVALVVVIGLFYRLYGIKDNRSFWQDEAHVARLGRDIDTGIKTIPQAIHSLNYEPLHILTTAVSMKFFGINEFAARLPAVILGSLGILAAFLLAKELSGDWGGILAAFLYAFSQLNLANSTQAKPYAALSAFTLFCFYFILKVQKSRKIKYHLLFITSASIATLFHFLGIILWVPYFLFLILKYGGKINTIYRKPKNIIAFLLLIIIFSILFRLDLILSGMFRIMIGGIKNHVNNFTYFRELFWKQYGFIMLPSIFGLMISFRKERFFSLLISAWISIIFLFWTFLYYTHNIRYIVPLFGVIFVLFGIFWSDVGRKLFNKKSLHISIIIIVIMVLGGNKIIRKPARYYNPNADIFGDVQIADYKSLFSKIRIKIPGYNNLSIFNDWMDAQVYYLPENPPTAYFMKGNFDKKPEKHNQDKTKIIYGSLNQFLQEKSKYSRGLLIVEDWESYLPEDIKQYAKKNMKLEFRVEGIPQAQGDNWPLEVYSWGL